MNILILCDEYPPCTHGGIGTVTNLLAREFIKAGHNVWICGFYPYFRKALTYENDLGIKVYRFFYGSKILLKLSKHSLTGKFFNIKRSFNKYTSQIHRIIEKEKIDIIEIPDYNESFIFSGPQLIEFPDFGIPLVVRLHGSHTFFSHIRKNKSYNPDIYRKEKVLLQSADLIIGVSKFVRDITYQLFDLRNKSEIVYNAIISDNKNNYNPGPDNYNVVFAGKIAEKKGAFSLLKAWNMVVEKVPEANLFLYGTANSQTLNYAYSLIEGNKKHSVHFQGYIERKDLPNIYRHSACAIFPSYAEAFGMTPLESMACGCPTIFTRRTSGTEIIDHKKNGILIDPENLEEIAKAIVLMINNRKEAVLMGHRGFTKVKNNFDLKKIVLKQIEIYQETISNV